MCSCSFWAFCCRTPKICHCANLRFAQWLYQRSSGKKTVLMMKKRCKKRTEVKKNMYLQWAARSAQQSKLSSPPRSSLRIIHVPVHLFCSLLPVKLYIQEALRSGQLFETCNGILCVDTCRPGAIAYNEDALLKCRHSIPTADPPLLKYNRITKAQIISFCRHFSNALCYVQLLLLSFLL